MHAVPSSASSCLPPALWKFLALHILVQRRQYQAEWMSAALAPDPAMTPASSLLLASADFKDLSALKRPTELKHGPAWLNMKERNPGKCQVVHIYYPTHTSPCPVGERDVINLQELNSTIVCMSFCWFLLHFLFLNFIFFLFSFSLSCFPLNCLLIFITTTLSFDAFKTV